MNTATYYAKALHALAEAHPEEGRAYLKNLREALALRGHEKLLPRIFSEYQRLEVQKKRTAQHREVTPQMQQTDTLLQLYHKLIAAK